MNRFIKLSSLVISDTISVIFSFVAACYLAQYHVELFTKTGAITIGIVVFVPLAVFLKLGLYRAVLRYASVDYLISVLKAVTVATLALVFGFYILRIHVSTQAIFIDWLITVFLIGGSRFLIRYYFELKMRYQKGRNVLIYGAGDMGALALRQLNLNKEVIYSPIGFIDDNLSKCGKIIQGIRVLGSLNSMESIVDRYHIEEVVVAIAEIDGEKLRDVVKRCREKNVLCRIIPCFSRLIELEPHMRNIELADLMRRLPRDLDKEAIKKYLENKKILITGAAGSIGSEIVRQCLRFNPHKILALDQSEFGLYSLSEELGSHKNNYILCDITNRNRLEDIFRIQKPDIVFHAAAYKHVPMLEYNTAEAINNNIGGTKNMCELAHKYDVKNFVMISTDKAVKPSNIMGATKRVCELIVQNMNARSDTLFMSVRFGNVLGSSGSVVPKFIEQIRKGDSISVTHPDATRYFMLTDEAVQLVLQAATIGRGGEIFILNMGKPVKIVEMAEDLIYLMGRVPYKDIKIEFTGLRSGEKVNEELFNDEIEKNTKFENITIGRSNLLNWEWLMENVNEMLECESIESEGNAVTILKKIVSNGSFKYSYDNHNLKLKNDRLELFADVNMV